MKTRALLLAYVLTFLIAISAAQAQFVAQPVKPEASAEAAATYNGVDLNRVVMFIHTSHDLRPTPRGLDETLLAKGWKAYVAEHVKPEFDWLRSKGVARPRLLIHCPYGMEAHSNYTFDMRRRCAQDARTKHVATGMGEAFRPLIAAGAEVIFYFGNFGDYNRPIPVGQADDTIREWEYCVKEAMDCGGSVAFDASSTLPEGSPQFGFLKLVAGFTTVYTEARPWGTSSHLFGYAVICQEQFWHISDPAKNVWSPWARTQDLRGEVIRWIQFPEGGFGGQVWEVGERYAKQAKRIQDEGHTPAVQAWWWRTAAANN